MSGEYISKYLTDEDVDAALDRAMSAVQPEDLDELKEDLTELQRGGYIADQQQIGAKISNWLDEHPEATTTVQDHSLTIDKMVVGTLGYATPQMYGAKGDGLTDDTDAFNDCIAENTLIFVPSGTYYLTDIVNLKSNIRMIFDSNVTIKSSYDDEHSTGYTFASFLAIGTEEEYLENIEFIGNGTIIDRLGSQSYCNHIMFKYTRNIVISGFSCINGGGKGVMLYYTDKFKVQRIETKNPTVVTAGHGYGVELSENCYDGIVEQIYGENLRHLVDIAVDCHEIQVRNCYGVKSSITAHGLSSYNVLIEGCILRNSTVSLGNITFDNDWKWDIVNCIFIDHDNSGPAVNIANASLDVTINNCRFYNCVQSVYVGSSQGEEAKDVNVINCIFDKCKQAVAFRNNVENCGIINCRFIECGGEDASSIIFVEGNEGTIISNCYFEECVTNLAGAIINNINSNLKVTNCRISGIGRGIIQNESNANTVIRDSSFDTTLQSIYSGKKKKKLSVFNCSCKVGQTSLFVRSACPTTLNNNDCDADVELFSVEEGHIVIGNTFRKKILVQGDYNLINSNVCYPVTGIVSPDFRGEHSVIANNLVMPSQV